MSPLWWMQSTAPHWTVMLEEVTADTLTEVGAADGAEIYQTEINLNIYTCFTCSYFIACILYQAISALL